MSRSRTRTGASARKRTFRGSIRQYRGRIVRFLIERKSGTDVETLAAECCIPAEIAEEVLRALTKDGLVSATEDKKQYCISHDRKESSR